MTEKVDVLIVDDRPEGLVTLEAVLTNPEYNLIKASSGQEALAKVLAHDFAVILMDVQMPDMDGYETATVIKQRERSKNIPIIFVTAINKAERYIATGYKVGAVDYILKPFDPQILKSKVAVFVDLYKKNRKLMEQERAFRDIERRDRARILAELELESRRRYQGLADAIPQMVWRSNKEGQLEYPNQFWHTYSGLSLEHSVGIGWRLIFDPEDIKEFDLKWADAIKSKIGFEAECRLRQNLDGEYRWHLIRIMPEFDNMSELCSWIGTATDIHDQKLVQEELLRAKEAADAASKAKSRFLANMSHEIRTPLGAILGFAELLINPNLNISEQSDFISTIRRNGEQLSKIIDEILDLSKVEAGKIDIENTDIQVAELLNDVNSSLTLAAKDKGLELIFTNEGEIPTTIRTDRTRFRQILINVVGNAIKFSPNGKIEVVTSFLPNEAESLFCLTVKDSGPGLTAEQIDGLFQPFTQADTSTTRKYGGTGLGLALSKRLAIALGGDVVVKESEPSSGCIFKITIKSGPLDHVTYTNFLMLDSVAVEPPKSSNENLTLQGIKVLLVEDSHDNQMLVSRFLNKAGAEVELANNGLEGVRKALLGNHDVVLMDIQMPELDGYGATTQLRESGFLKPIIALTAHAMVSERRRCLNAGFNDHLTKPVNRLALIERIHNFSAEGFGIPVNH